MFAATWEPFAFGLTGAAIPTLITALVSRRKNRADSADIITQAAARAVTMLQAQIETLEQQIEQLQMQVNTERTERAVLNLRLAQAEQREQDHLHRIAELQGEIDQLRLRVQRYETPIIPPKEG